MNVHKYDCKGSISDSQMLQHTGTMQSFYDVQHTARHEADKAMKQELACTASAWPVVPEHTSS